MSKYTEAIESLGTIFKCNVCDMEVANCMECDFLHDTCLEALQIADRLEQITENGTNRITEVLCKDCKEKELRGCWGICRAMANVIDGYELALADIRGDE